MNEQTGHILLVDDEPHALKMYALLLRNTGYTVHGFLSSVEALSFLRFTEKPIELIITDLNMPQMDGLRFLKQVRQTPDYLPTPFMFLSAIDDKNFRLKAYQDGALDYLQKPIDNSVFMAKVNSVINAFRILALRHTILFSGNQDTFSIEEILQYCEQEKVDGFTFIAGLENDGYLVFEKGMVKEISTQGLSDSDAFEKISSWKQYRFIIARGLYNPGAALFLGVS